MVQKRAQAEEDAVKEISNLTSGMLMVHLNWWFTGTLEEREMRGPSIPNLHIFLILSGTKVLSVYA